jgi:CHAT domain-containing protein
VADARRRERETFAKVALLVGRMRLLRGRGGLAEADRRARLGKLAADLAAARRDHLSARRAVFNLAGTHAARDLKPLTAGQVQALLSGKQRLLLYTVSRRDAVLLIVGPPGEAVRGRLLKWPGGKAVTGPTLAAVVERHLEGMVSAGAHARGVRREPTSAPARADRAAKGYRLFQALVPPDLWAELRSAELVYVVPDGALHRLPFETLVVAPPAGRASRGPLRYWLDEGPAIAYGPSATVLVNRRSVRDEQVRRWAAGGARMPQAVLLGDPVFRRGAPMSQPATQPDTGTPARGLYLTRYAALAPLAGTREEVRRIYRTLTGREYGKGAARGDVVVLLGEDATRKRLFTAAAGCRYLHLATHALVDTSDNALYSSLALTQPQRPAPDDFGFLTLVDLFDNWWGRLGATELVVLSACRTQCGRMEGGEGVFSIPWGFMYAGSPAVIASLWQVADDSTAEMMSDLYRQIALRQARGERNAKLAAFVAVRKALRARRGEPYYWAPFVYLGDPR